MSSETKRRGLRRPAGLVLTAATALGLAGCAHNDVLVFGTSTTIGLNIESVSAEGAPSIVLGYEREEAVWMPLIVNGADSRPLCGQREGQVRCADSQSQSNTLEQAMYQSTITTGEGQAQQVQTDAYSVFASLGARFNGSANGSGVNAGGGLAQFFATGNAALNVSANTALVTALKIESSEGAAAQATAVAAASSNQTVSSITGALSAADNASAVEAGRAAADRHSLRVDRAMVCASNTDGTLRWDALVDSVPTYTPEQRDGLKRRKTRTEIRARLQNSEPITNAILTAAALPPFNCAVS